jgi:hypothetical protein
MLEYFEFIDKNPILGYRQVEATYCEKLDALYATMKEFNKKGKAFQSDNLMINYHPRPFTRLYEVQESIG